jgi:hypothetical protein
VLAERQRKEDHATIGNRDRWAHMQEMAGTRRADSSSNSFATAPSSFVPQQTIVVSSVNPIRSTDMLESNVVRTMPTPIVTPVGSIAPVGSCVPPSLALAGTNTELVVLPFQNPRKDSEFGCLNCGKNRHISQERDPWEYRAP